jgi:hypothetical protein
MRKLKKLKAKFVNIAIPQIDSTEDGLEVEVIQREKSFAWEDYLRGKN